MADDQKAAEAEVQGPQQELAKGVPDEVGDSVPDQDTQASDGNDQEASLVEEEVPDSDERELEELRAVEEPFGWQASEYVHHHKGPFWYVALIICVLILVAAAVLLRNWLAAVAFLVMGGAMFVYASKPPRILSYEISRDGIVIDGRSFPYAAFRAYGLLKEEEWHTIDLEPVKRFSPRVSILYSPEDVDEVMGHLDLHLPRSDREPDAIEKLTRMIRF